MTVTEEGSLGVLVLRVRTVTWKPASRSWLRMAGPRLPVACVRCGGQSSLGDITAVISGRARWYICIKLFAYPSQSDFGDATHLVGDI